MEDAILFAIKQNKLFLGVFSKLNKRFPDREDISPAIIRKTTKIYKSIDIQSIEKTTKAIKSIKCAYSNE